MSNETTLDDVLAQADEDRRCKSEGQWLPIPVELYDQMRAALEEARRYRWLRAPENDEDISSLIRIYSYGEEAELMSGEELDAAIDAAQEVGK
ncbi:hypothetical protein [Novilysobacter erysipheiresistens]|uniref:Uncharacterized protein n=1 Tax=Novilysobacter erysipheiresistens TaxID=1749332 RepID=A0ABU7YUW0_9GAMM